MTKEPTRPGGTIDYELLAQDALRGVVRAVLQRTATSGLPGEHHFYISFDTQAPGVTISKRLKEKYPEEMTIVLQHRFWGLQVSDDRFEVKLTFDGIPERLVVPFVAIRVFCDPSVRFMLQFEDPSETGEAEAEAPADRRPEREPPSRPTPVGRDASPVRTLAERKPKAPRSARPKPEAKPAPAEARPEPVATAPPRPSEPPRIAPAPKPALRPELAEVSEGEPPKEPAPQSGAQIVSLDQFRKK